MLKLEEEVSSVDTMLFDMKNQIFQMSERHKHFRSSAYERCRSVDSDGDEVSNIESIDLQIEITKCNIELVNMRSEYALKKSRRLSIKNELKHRKDSLKLKRI